MTHKEAEEDDPLEFIGVGVPVEDEEAADETMIRAVVDEYLLMGFDEDKIMELFRMPFYQGTHDVLRRRGEGFVRERVTAALAEWRGGLR